MNPIYRITTRTMNNLSAIRNIVPPKSVININKIFHEQNAIRKSVEKNRRDLQYTRDELASMKERFSAIEKTINSSSNEKKKDNFYTITGKQPFIPFGV